MMYNINFLLSDLVVAYQVLHSVCFGVKQPFYIFRLYSVAEVLLKKINETLSLFILCIINAFYYTHSHRGWQQ